VLHGERDVLWPGKPTYFAKTSGTTSGIKYIPMTKASVIHQFTSSRDAVLNYVHETGRSQFLDGGLIFFPEARCSMKKRDQNGRLSASSTTMCRHTCAPTKSPATRLIVSTIGKKSWTASSTKP